jgi:hypothetical protein
MNKLEKAINYAVIHKREFEFMEYFKRGLFPDSKLGKKDIDWTLDQYNRFLKELRDKETAKYCALEMFSDYVKIAYKKVGK